MSKLSQYLGYSGIAPGTHVVSYDDLGDGWLRCGELQPYRAEHHQAVVAAPSLRVLGTDAAGVNAGVAGETGKFRAPTWYMKAGTVWVACTAGEPVRWSTDLRNWTPHDVSVPYVGDDSLFVRRGGSNHMGHALPTSASGKGIIILNNGAYDVAAGIASYGGWSAIVGSPSGWTAVRSFDGNNYIASCRYADPRQAWSVTRSPNLGMRNCFAAAHGGAGFVFVGRSNTSGQIIMSVTPHVGWENITSRVPFSLGACVLDVVYNGSLYFFQTETQLFTSHDLVSFHLVSTPIGAYLKYAYMSTASATVVLAYNDGAQRFIAYTSDNGATWKVVQPYLRVTGVSPSPGCGAVSYTGEWVANFSGTSGGLINLGSSLDAMPNWIGSQFSPGPGWFVRV